MGRKMILTIDIGNTNIVLACIQDENILIVERLETDITCSVEAYSYSIKSLLERGIKLDEIKGSIISSVVPSLTYVLKDSVSAITCTTPFILGPEAETGLNILVQNPGQLGNDRIADAAAAVHYYGKPAIIIDMGTATTVSVIDANSGFIGGMIMLGVKSSLEALSNKAAQLPHIELEACTNIIGRNTIECMRNGSVIGHAAMIDGIIKRLKKQVGENAAVIVTGGLSRLIIPYCEEKLIYDEHLLIKGLYLIYFKNGNKFC